MHSIGLSSKRPRLKGRPSLYDLVRASSLNGDPLPVATAKLVDTHPDKIASAVPLPASPQQQRKLQRHSATSSSSSELSQPSNIPKADPKMAPVRQNTSKYVTDIH